MTEEPRKMTRAEAGRKGGRTTKERYGEEHFGRIGKIGGKKGGETTKQRYGSEFYQKIGAHSRVGSRSQLHDSFAGNAGFLASSYTLSRPNTRVMPGGTSVVNISGPIGRLGFGSLDFTSEGGVYPLTVSLYNRSTSSQLATLTTPLTYYPATPEHPLDIVFVALLNAKPAEDPDGDFSADE